MQALRGEAARYEKPETEKEAAIVRAATRVFGAKGYAAARTAEIARAAGVTERTLFRYFPSKQRLYRRVMFPALLSAAAPRALREAGELFAADAESFAAWHGRVLRLRTGAAKQAAPQFRLLAAGLLADASLRRKVIPLWKKNVLQPLVRAVRRFQQRGELRSDVAAERIARAILSVNLGYVIARALLAPDAKWDDESEIAASVELLRSGAARR